MPPRRPTEGEIDRRLTQLEQNHVPCPGPALRTDVEVVKEQVAGLRNWETQQNGKLGLLAEKLDKSREERQAQIDALQKQVSNNHTETITLLAQRDRQMFVLLVTAAVSLIVSVGMALFTFGLRAVGGP